MSSQETRAGPSAVEAIDPGSARAELARLLSARAPARRLLRERVEAFLALGVALGALHLAAGRSGGDHVALTAMLAALVPVFAPVCFIPAVFAGRERGGVPPGVIIVRLAVVVALGVLVAAVHLLVWALLASLTGSIGGPGTGDVPFMVVTVLVTALVASAAYQAPIRGRWAQPATVGAVLALYVGSFACHGLLLTPSLSMVRHKLGAVSGAIEVVLAIAALTTVAILMRREVRAGIRQAVSPLDGPGSGTSIGSPQRESSTRRDAGRIL